MYCLLATTCKKIIFSSLLLLGILVSFYTQIVHAENELKVRKLETVNLQLKWIHQFQFAGYYAAKQQGYYADEGLDVQIHAFNMDQPVIQSILSGTANYGVGDIGILFNYAKGDPIKALAAIFQHNPLIFISKKSSGIFSPYELVGKRVMQRSVTNDTPLRAMLAVSGIDINQYTEVKHNFKIDDFISGKVDVMSGYITDQPYAIRQQGVDINIIQPQNYGIDFYGDLLFTSKQELKNHPGRADRFLRASLKGWQYAFENTEELILLIKQQYHSRSSIERLRSEALETKRLVLPNTIPLGQIQVNRLRHVSNIYNRLKLSRKLNDKELRSFIHANNSTVNLSAEEQAWLKQHPIIRLGIDKNFAPYETLTEQGKYVGIAADYIKLIEQRLNIHFEIIEDKHSWHDVLNAAKQGELDMLSCLVKTPDRETFLNFSEPYLNSSAVIISEQSNGYIGSLKQLAGKQVAIQKGHYTQELLAKNHPEITIISTPSIEDALSLVSNGEVDAYVGDVTSASYIMKKKGFLNLVFSGATPYQSQFSFATHKKSPLLASIINKTLATISQAERNKIYDHWRSLKITQGIRTNTIIIYASAIFSLFLLFAYWVYRLHTSETNLKASQAKLQLILDTEAECVKILDADGCLIQMNRAGLEMIEVKDASLVIGQKVDNLVVKEFRAAFNAMNARVLKGEKCTLEYQINSVNNRTLWVDAHAVPLIDEKTKSVSVLAVTRDITARKKTEESQKIAALVYQNSSEAMMVLNEHNQIIAINPAFTKITGYCFDEVDGKNPSILKSERQDANFYKEMWQSIDKTGHWEGEIWNKHKDGEDYAEWLIINTIFTEEGKLAQRVALFSDITEKKKAHELIWNQANFDPLTRLPNRNMFMDRLDLDIKVASRSEKPLAIIFLDLDRFKEVNDSLGHDKGDILLCEAAERLTACVRKSDTVTRLGGDEFIIILPELDDVHIIDRVAQTIIQNLSEPFNLNGEQAYISASLGIALYPDDANDSKGLIKHADQAMYLSKEMGRSRYSYFTKSMQDQAQSRLQLLNDMRGALAKDQFELYYQPIIDLKTNQIVKAEALIRWNHPTRGLISPANFIPLAEESGLIIDIGDWVFKQTVQQVKHWRKTYKNLQVSVNKSPIQFRAATDCDDWINYLKQINLSGDAIAIEITEGLLMDNASNITHQLLQYRDAGIQVSMDDFGTGYSALSYLNKFHIDYLKIDQSFTRNLSVDSNDMALSEAIILMSHKLGLKVIAEGIETEEQKQLLIAADCNYGQGYLFSKPVPAAQFEKLLFNNRTPLNKS